MSSKDSVEIHLGYFKQGDDLSFYLEQVKNSKDKPLEALKMHAESMRMVGQHLDEIAAVVQKHGCKDVEIEADVHFIMLTGPQALLDELVEKKLAQYPEWDDDEDEDDDDCDGEDEGDEDNAE